MQKALHDLMDENAQGVEASLAGDLSKSPDAGSMPELIDTSPVVATTTLSSLPVDPKPRFTPAPPPVSLPVPTPSSSKPNGTGNANGAGAGGGGLGGLVRYADSDGSDVDMDV
jgi:hypothetical protein